MADSLFDNRYRYDYIYPRGRSGETLRAVDTLQNDRPVVIKRPAPNDAPPIRAGQEVSILNERKALTRLAGHPVLTEFLADGQFFVGGVPHQYIVMERAQGMVVADTVLTLARSGERMPTLEMLVILDHLLDLLQAAHEKEIIYNDVDAKHLFWSRETYRLKVIDWGNAVFLEGDEVTPQGISRQTDVFQVGELMYFVLSGGGRADIPRDAGDDFRADFGTDADLITPYLQQIISKALHPNTRFRYRTVTDLRQALNDYRRPLERERDTTLSHVNERLRRDLSKTELKGLLSTIEPALKVDPGHPATRKAHQEIQDRLRDLEVSADLDAVRIYIEGNNWSRAADLLNELRDKAGSQTSAKVELLLDCGMLLLDVPQAPPAVLDAIGMIFDGRIPRAARALLTQTPPDAEARRIQWLLAERISSRIPEVLLLRPNLYRLELALENLEGGGVNLTDARTTLKEINDLLDDLPGKSVTDLAQLRDSYRMLVDRLTMLNKLLSTVMVQQRLANNQLPLNSLDRALNAAMALADNVHIIGKQAASSPRDAMVALDTCRGIDPANTLWDSIANLLNNLYELLQSYQTYIPAADGSDLERWLKDSRKDLMPFLERLFDDLLIEMVEGLKTASESWRDYAANAVQGNRTGALDALGRGSQAVSILSPTLSGWLNQLRNVVEGANYVERHAIFGGLGRALADGWEAFDRGRLVEAEQLGQRAVEIASSEPEDFAARRLLNLATLLREWVERDSVNNAGRTQAALAQVEKLYKPDEIKARESFAAQMPTRETYLRAVTKGLIDIYARESTPARRIFFCNAVLLGALEAHDAKLEDALFWRDVASKSLGDNGARHPANRALEEFVAQRREINAVAEQLNMLNGKHALENLAATRRRLEDSTQAKLFAPAAQSIRELETAVRDWADGEFRTAGMKLENAIKGLNEAEQAADIDLRHYLDWLVDLQQVAAELHTVNRQMRQTIERRPSEPVDTVLDAHRRSVDMTEEMLGETTAAQLRQWRDTYEEFLAAYTDQSIRRSGRLARFNELFKAMFIDRHPAYALYRHWYDLMENAPEFPAPPTSEPTPRLSEEEEPAEDFITTYEGSRYADDAPLGLRIRWKYVLPVLAVLIAVGAVVASVLMDNGDEEDPFANIPVTISDTPNATQVALGETMTAEPGEVIPPVNMPPGETTDEAGGAISLITPTLITPIVRESNTPLPTDTPTTQPSPTTIPTRAPTDTPVPTDTLVPSDTPTPTLTPIPTLPPQGLQGWQDLLALTTRLDELPWDEDLFMPMVGSWQLGQSAGADGERLEIVMSAEILDEYYGNVAPSRIRRTEANLSFVTFNPSVLELQEVEFGILLQSASDPDVQVGLLIQVVDLNAVNLVIIDAEGNEELITLRSVNSINPRVRLERNAIDGDVTVFFDDFQIGGEIPFVLPEAPVEPVLFVNDGGVLVSVLNWRVGLQ